MSKLHIKSKDEIIIKLVTKLEDKHRSTTSEARAVNHGWVQAMEWVLGMFNPINRGESVIETVLDDISKDIRVDGGQNDS
jgi:hypothetical protein